VKVSVKKLPPIHPGEILREEFMKPRDLSQNALVRALHVPPRRINEIVLEKRRITADTALRLALSLSRGNGRGWRSRVRVKGENISTSAELWTGLQADYDLRLARQKKARVLERDVEPLTALQPAMA
jgi:antitoxin HigA-1